MKLIYLQTLKFSTLLLSLSLLGLGCANARNINDIKQDPFAPINRKIYTFNKVVDAMYIKPISMTYSKIIPKPVKNSVGNFFSNIGEVPNAANHVVQGKFKYATINVIRLLVNSTFGLCGAFDIATPMGFTIHKTDFGQTLMKLGYKQSRYLVLPILGASTVRDSFGIVGNNFVSAQYYLKPKWRNSYLVAQSVHKRADLQEVVDIVDMAGVDEYALVRDAYLQRRQYLNDDGITPVANDLLQGPPE